MKNNYCLQSKPDSNDFYIPAESTPSEKFKCLVHFCPPIRNQKNLGSCASHGLITCYESELIKKDKYIEMSELYHYYNARLVDGNEKKNVGMTMRQSCKTLKQNGLSFEKYWPYYIDLYKFEPSAVNYWLNVFLNVHPKFKVKTYYIVDSIQDAIRWIDEDNTIIAAGIKVFPAFMKAFNKSDITMDDIKNVDLSKYGGHCVNIIGYNLNAKQLLIRNSWGTEWGTYGYIWIDFDVWDEICFEMRTVVV